MTIEKFCLGKNFLFRLKNSSLEWKKLENLNYNFWLTILFNRVFPFKNEWEVHDKITHLLLLITKEYGEAIQIKWKI